jgi:hypothetical protein
MKTKRFFNLVSAGALGVATASGAVIFTDDFSSGDFSNWDNIDSGDNNPLLTDLNVLTDSGNLFGEGTGNRFAQFIDEEDNDTVYIGKGAALTNVATYQFDFIDTGTDRGVAFRLDQTPSSSSNDSYVQVIVQGESLNIRSAGTNATFGSYTRDTEYRLTIIANNSGSAINNYFGTNSLANDSYAVWLTPVGGASVLVKGDAQFTETTNSNAFTSIAAQTFSGATGVDFYLDNVEAFSGVEVSGLSAVPEPATYAALLGVLALGFVVYRRRRR